MPFPNGMTITKYVKRKKPLFLFGDQTKEILPLKNFVSKKRFSHLFGDYVRQEFRFLKDNLQKRGSSHFQDVRVGPAQKISFNMFL